MGSRNRIKIEEFHVVAARVVVAADEPGILGNVDALLPQALADLRPVGHCGKESCVRTATTSPARPAIVCRLVRIVKAGRSMAQNHDQASESVREPRRAQHTGDAFCLFLWAEPRQYTCDGALGLLRVSHQREFCPRLREKFPV